MTAIEYALIATFISLAILAGTKLLGSKVNTNFGYISNSLN